MTDGNLKIIDDAVSRATLVEGWMHEMELYWLATMARHAKVIVEVGSWKGRFTKALAVSTSGIVISIDSWMGAKNPLDVTAVEAREKGSEALYKIFQNNLIDEIKGGKVIPIWAENHVSLPHLERILAGRKADMIFIDSDHEYDSVKKDIQTFSPYLKDGGLLCGHDFAPSLFPGVVKAVGELVPGFSTPVGSIWQKQIFSKVQ